MTKKIKPVALSLADFLIQHTDIDFDGVFAKSAGELRKLQDANTKLLKALDVAHDWIAGAQHGDNCFLHDDGGEYDKCFCGKDSMESFIERVCTHYRK